MFNEYIYEMRGLMHIKRYQNKKRLCDRRVADHIWATAKIAHMLALWHTELTGERVNMRELLEHALFRGTLKLFTGEFQESTRTATPGMKKAVAEVSRIIYDSKYKVLLPVSMDTSLIREYVLKEPSKSTIEGRILKLASLIDGSIECIEEINLANKRYYQEILESKLHEIWELNLTVGKMYVLEQQKTAHISNKYKKHRMKTALKSEDMLKYDAFIEAFIPYIETIRNLMEIERYQNTYRNKVRTVAQHEWSVSLISLCMAYREIESGNSVDIEKLIQVALCHDDIEMMTGDILSNTKKITKTLGVEIEKIEEMLFDEQFTSLLPKSNISNIKEWVLNPKDDSIEGSIISFADTLDTMYEAVEEMELGNVKTFEDVYDKAIEKMKRLSPLLANGEKICREMEISYSK